MVFFILVLKNLYTVLVYVYVIRGSSGVNLRYTFYVVDFNGHFKKVLIL